MGDAGDEGIPRDLRRILVVDGGALDPGTSAGARATVDLIDALVGLGADVRFLPLGSRGHGELDQLRELGRRGARAYRPLDRDIHAVLDAEPVDVVIANRPGPGALVVGALRAHEGVVRVYWGHDIHDRRLAGQEDVQGDIGGHARRATALAERQCWQAYDLTVYPTDREAGMVNEALGGADALGAAACPYYELSGADLRADAASPDGRKGVLMVGGALHAPNRDAVEWAAREIFPSLRALDPSLAITVVGEWPMDLVRAVARPGIDFTGVVSDRELRSWHDRSLCLLAPLRFGSGARRKIVAAMGLGLPVVTTSEGQEGVLVRDGRGADDGLTIADTAEGLAAAVRHLHADPAVWRDLSARALGAARATYSATAFRASVRDVLVQAVLNARHHRLHVTP